MCVAITFESVHSNVRKFKVTGLGPEWTDRVRVDDNKHSCPPTREALSIYGFWLDLKTLIEKHFGSEKPALVTNDLPLMGHYYNFYSTQCKLHDPWPFKGEAPAVVENL